MNENEDDSMQKPIQQKRVGMNINNDDMLLNQSNFFGAIELMPGFLTQYKRDKGKEL